MKNKKDDELFFQIALTQAEAIGPKRGRALISHFGSAKAIFQADSTELQTIDFFGKERIKSLKKEIDTESIETEIKFMEDHKIQPLFLQDPYYPKRLLQCPDAPLLLYYKGNANLNHSKIISIVGTRLNSDYGLRCAENLVQGLVHSNVLIVSGLASGIDGISHRKAVELDIPTVGVVAHGLNMIYPHQHKILASEMIKNGGLLTEFSSKTIPDRQNFPLRNRIVAGIADITIVVETNQKGGSMITAKLATGYNREVAAFPGRSIDQKSKGCNYLIKTQIAHLIENSDDLLDLMNWKEEKKKSIQSRLFKSLSEEELKVTDILENSEGMHIDELGLKSKISNSKLASILLNLEMEDIIKSLPGKRYRLN